MRTKIPNSGVGRGSRRSHASHGCRGSRGREHAPQSRYGFRVEEACGTWAAQSGWWSWELRKVENMRMGLGFRVSDLGMGFGFRL